MKSDPVLGSRLSLREVRRRGTLLQDIFIKLWANMDKEIVGYSKGKVDFWDDIQDVMSCKYLYQGSSAWEAWAGQWAMWWIENWLKGL